MQVISILLAFFLIYSSFFSFGQILVDHFQLKLTSLGRLSFGLIFSIILITPVIAIMGLIFGPIAYWLIVIVSIIGLKRVKFTSQLILNIFSNASKKKLLSLFMLLSVTIFVSTVCLSGITWDARIYFQEIHDSVWHLALINNLQDAIPPLHPSFPSIVLKNYHYFYDLILAVLVNISGILPSILYFQIFPILLAFMLISQAYLLGKKIGNNNTGYWLIFLTIFAGSFAYLIPVFLHGQTWSESSFWVSQTFIMIVNPQVILTLSLTYAILNLLFDSCFTTRRYLLIILLIASSIGFKSYAWVVLSVVFATYLISTIVKKRSIKPLIFGFLHIAISLPLMWLITGFESGTFFYHPLWFINSMIESPDRVNYLKWKFMEDHYRYLDRWYRILELKIKELLIFFVGNLGTRSLFLLIPIFYLKKNKPLKSSSLIIICLVGFLFCSIFPLLFLQRGSVWNSIQFWYYGLIFTNVLTSIVINKFIKTKKIAFSVILSVVFIILAIPTTIKTLKDKTTRFHSIPITQLAYFQSLKSDDNILLCPESDPLYQTSLIRAYSKASVYFANPVQLQILYKYSDEIESFESMMNNMNSDDLKKLVEENHITHIFCLNKKKVEWIQNTLSNKISKTSTLDLWVFFELI